MSWSQNGITRSSGPSFLLFHRKTSSSSTPRSESISGYWLCFPIVWMYLHTYCSSFKFSLQAPFLNADPFTSAHCRETNRRKVLLGTTELLLPGGWGENLICCFGLLGVVLGWGNSASSLHNQGGESVENSPCSCLPAGTCSLSTNGCRLVHSKGY